MVTRTAVVAGMWLTSLAGCSTLWKKPVADDVFAARQLALRGMDEMQRGEWEYAEKTLARAVKTCPDDQQARRSYAETLLRRGAYQEALRHMIEAVRISGNATELTVQLGEMYLLGDQLDQARQRARSAIRGDRRYAPAWALQAQIQHRRGQPEAALSSYLRALSIQPNNAEVRLATARLYRDLNRPHHALAMLSALSEQFSPGKAPPEVLLEEGLAHSALGKHQEAVETLAAAAAQDQQSPELLYQLARSQWLAGDVGNARLSVDQALRLNPGHSPSLALAAEIQQGQQRTAAVR